MQGRSRCRRRPRRRGCRSASADAPGPRRSAGSGRLIFTGFKFGTGFAGLTLHLQHEWVILANLFLLLTGFALLSRHFEAGGVPDEMPAFLPDDWKGGLVLLVVVFVLSAFLDNIAGRSG
jgi:hypothetical protein